jgi:medium-chain acyl-[acyl-carrier-protein] hydrolase
MYFCQTIQNLIMTPFFSKQFEVGSHLIDKKFDIRLPYLLGYMQEVAEQHSADQHVAWEDLQKKNAFWTLYRMGLQFEQFPHWHDTIDITTWANTPDNLIQPRCFEIQNQRQQVIVKAYSLWTILDTINFKPQIVSDIVGDIIPCSDKGKDLFEKNLKIPKVSISDASPICTREVLYSDIDTNNHVNNTRYVGWLLDSYALDFLETHHLKTIIINYTSQAHLGDHYEIYTQIKDCNTHFSTIIDRKTNAEFCKIKTIWTGISQPQ